MLTPSFTNSQGSELALIAADKRSDHLEGSLDHAEQQVVELKSQVSRAHVHLRSMGQRCRAMEVHLLVVADVVFPNWTGHMLNMHWNDS